jgi:hypothetical protein
MIEDLANSRYLMTAYATSSDSWEIFRQTGQQTQLFEVAAILCGAWTTLSEDEDFVEGLAEVSEQRMAPDMREAMQMGFIEPDADPARKQVLQELLAHQETDKLLARELVVLVQAGMQPAHAVRLVADLQTLLRPRIEPLSDYELSSLRTNIPQLADALCKAQRTLKGFNYDVASETENGRPPHRGWVRAYRLLGKVLVATAGAAGAAGNVAAAVASFGAATGLSLASVIAGGQVLLQAVADARDPHFQAPSVGAP